MYQGLAKALVEERQAEEQRQLQSQATSEEVRGRDDSKEPGLPKRGRQSSLRAPTPLYPNTPVPTWALGPLEPWGHLSPGPKSTFLVVCRTGVGRKTISNPGSPPFLVNVGVGIIQIE